jgi:hypothetical protein
MPGFWGFEKRVESWESVAAVGGQVGKRGHDVGH